jgi:hypothetical protein
MIFEALYIYYIFHDNMAYILLISFIKTLCIFYIMDDLIFLEITQSFKKKKKILRILIINYTL